MPVAFESEDEEQAYLQRLRAWSGSSVACMATLAKQELERYETFQRTGQIPVPDIGAMMTKAMASAPKASPRPHAPAPQLKPFDGLQTPSLRSKPAAREESSMNKFQQAMADLQALAKGNGPDADKARRALAAMNQATPSSAMGPGRELQVTRHSPHAGLLDDAFGTGPARGARNEGTRTILTPTPLRHL